MRIVRRTIRMGGQNKIYCSNQGWRTIAQDKRYYFRSSWEVDFARYLQFLKENALIKEWEYEPKIFYFEEIKTGTRSYKPDFKVTRIDGSHYWAEVKGYLDKKSTTKMKRFKKYYPQEELRLIDADWFKENCKKFPFMSNRGECDVD